MKKRILILSMLVVAMGLGSLSAQTHFSLRLGGAFPMGTFANANANYTTPSNPANDLRWGLIDQSNKGGAGLGFTAGALVKFDIKSVKGLGIIASVDGIYNSLNSDVTDYYADLTDEKENSASQVEYTNSLPRYINVPILVGLGYTYDLKETFGLYGEVAIGANVRFITGRTFTNVTQAGTTQNETIDSYSYDVATTFAYRVGAGIVFNKKYTLGVDYYALGTAKAVSTLEREVNGKEQRVSNATTKHGKISPAEVMVRFGINF